MKLFCVGLLSGLLLAQSLPYSMSYQGEGAIPLLLNKRKQKRYREFALVNTTTCNETKDVVTLPVARIDQQIEFRGMTVIAPAVIIAEINKVESKDPKRILVDLARYAAFGFTLYAGFSKASLDTVRTVAPVASISLQEISDRLLKDIPASRVDTLQSALFARELVLVPNGCGQVMRVVAWAGNYPRVVVGTIPLVSSGMLGPVRPEDNLTCLPGSPCGGLK